MIMLYMVTEASLLSNQISRITFYWTNTNTNPNS